jgi:HK97 family phage major capsid protein
MDLNAQLETLQKELKSYHEKAAAQQAANGTMSAELTAQITAVQKQVDAIDLKLADRIINGSPEKSLADTLNENEDVQRLLRDHKGNIVINLDAKQVRQLERKTTISNTAVGFATTGVLPIERLPGITPEARQTLTIADMLVRTPTTQAIIDFVKVNAGPAIASPQTEAADKGENSTTFTAASEKVQTIATWIPATRQVLDDMPELLMFLETMLPYYVNLEEEREILNGAGTTDLHGLVTQATAYNTALTPAVGGWNRIDIIGRVIQQIMTAKELAPTFVALNPLDYWSIMLTKDSYGRYIMGNPQQPGIIMQTGGVSMNAPNIFGLVLVPTTSMTSGTFLVGSGSPIAVEIRDRMTMQIEIATQHSDFFTKNLVAVRAEKREALIVRRTASFIKGSFTTSPTGN